MEISEAALLGNTMVTQYGCGLCFQVSSLREEVARRGHEAQALRAQLADFERQAAADASIKVSFPFTEQPSSDYPCNREATFTQPGQNLR